LRIPLHPFRPRLLSSLQRQGITLTLVDVNEQPRSLMRRSGFEAELGAMHIVDNWSVLRLPQVAPDQAPGRQVRHGADA
jgi:hypothetical protein